MYKKKTEQKQKFSHTSHGYMKAKKFLKSIGEYDYFMNNSISTDGYSLVEFANHRWVGMNHGSST